MFSHLTKRNENSAMQNESEGSEEVLNRKEEREETKDDRRHEAYSSNFATIPTARDRNKNFIRNEMIEDKKKFNNMVNFIIARLANDLR